MKGLFIKSFAIALLSASSLWLAYLVFELQYWAMKMLAFTFLVVSLLGFKQALK